MSKITRIIASIWIAVASLIATTAHGDPLPGEILKFQQLPLNNTVVGPAIYQGHEEPSTAYPYVNSQGVVGWQGFFAADDFADNFSTPIVHLKWWGNYMSNPNNTAVQQFLISFESDIPVGPGQPFSTPGTPLLSQYVTAGALSPGSGTFTESTINTTTGLKQYNAELNLGQGFPELADTVYWVKIVALTTDTSMVWGWHNRDYTVQNTLASPNVTPGEGLVGPAFLPMWHFQDDNVRGGLTVDPVVGGGLSVNQFSMNPSMYIDNTDGPAGVSLASQDLAFELYTQVPEPTSLSALPLAALVLMRRRR